MQGVVFLGGVQVEKGSFGAGQGCDVVPWNPAGGQEIVQLDDPFDPLFQKACDDRQTAAAVQGVQRFDPLVTGRNDDVVTVGAGVKMPDDRLAQKRHVAGGDKDQLGGGVLQGGMDAGQGTFTDVVVRNLWAGEKTVQLRTVGDQHGVVAQAVKPVVDMLDQWGAVQLQQGLVATHA